MESADLVEHSSETIFGDLGENLMKLGTNLFILVLITAAFGFLLSQYIELRKDLRRLLGERKEIKDRVTVCESTLNSYSEAKQAAEDENAFLSSRVQQLETMLIEEIGRKEAALAEVERMKSAMVQASSQETAQSAGTKVVQESGKGMGKSRLEPMLNQNEPQAGSQIGRLPGAAVFGLPGMPAEARGPLGLFLSLACSFLFAAILMGARRWE